MLKRRNPAVRRKERRKVEKPPVSKARKNSIIGIVQKRMRIP